MSKIESDIANPDSALNVLFYSRPLQNEFESEQQKRPIFYDVDMIKIWTPGDDKNIVDTFARDDHKARFPQQWAHYMNKKSGDQSMAGKTPLNQWPRLTPAMVEELRAIKFFSVEDVAHASDANIQRIGMIAGMSPHAFREAAKSYLRLAAGEANESQATAEAAAAREEAAELRKQMALMQEQMSKLVAATASAPLGLEALASANPAADEPQVTTTKRTRS